MGNIGEDPNEYLPRDYRQDAPPQPAGTKYPPNNNLNDVPYNNDYGNQGYNDGDMNGPTSVAMYERQSPNPAMNHHTVSPRPASLHTVYNIFGIFFKLL